MGSANKVVAQLLKWCAQIEFPLFKPQLRETGAFREQRTGERERESIIKQKTERKKEKKKKLIATERLWNWEAVKMN